MEGGRLTGVIWPIWPTGVAHYAGEVGGLDGAALALPPHHRSSCRLGAVSTMTCLVLSHTRTALLAMFMGLLVGGGTLLLQGDGFARLSP